MKFGGFFFYFVGRQQRRKELVRKKANKINSFANGTYFDDIPLRVGLCVCAYVVPNQNVRCQFTFNSNTQYNSPYEISIFVLLPDFTALQPFTTSTAQYQSKPNYLVRLNMYSIDMINLSLSFSNPRRFVFIMQQKY